MRNPFMVSAYLAGFLSLGILAAYYLQASASWCLPAAISLLILLWMVRKKASARVYWVLVGVGIGLFGFWRMATTLPSNRPLHFLNMPEATRIHVRILKALRHSDFAKNYVGTVISLDGQASEGELLLRSDREDTTYLTPGMELLTPNNPISLNPPLNPGQFDYREYLQHQGIHGQLRLRPDSYLVLPGAHSNPGGFLERWRARLLHNLNTSGLSAGPLGVARALLLGDRRDIAPSIQGNYRKAGALHLLAVSGLHVGILAAFIFGLLSPLRRFPGGRVLHLVAGMVFLWGYAGIAGFSPSVVRAVILYSVVAYALLRQRPGQTLHFLAIAWTFMLSVIHPGWLFQAGFLLSFAAVTGIVVFFPPLYRIWPWKQAPGSYIGKLLAVSLAAQAGTLPLTLFFFHQFPGLFLLSNLLLLPGIGLVLSMGFLCLLLRTLNLLPTHLIDAYDTLLEGMNQLVAWIAQREDFQWENIPWGHAELVCWGLALILMGMYLKQRKPVMLSGALGCLLALQLYGIIEWHQSSGRHTLIIPHRVGQSAVWVLKGDRLQVFSRDSTAFARQVRDAQIHWKAELVSYKELQHYLRSDALLLRLVDSSGLYSPLESGPDILLLSGSPKIHLGRLLEVWKPRQVVADGSNYKSLLPHWKASCEHLGIPFHATATQGAFVHQLQDR